jgi:kinesin family member 6/9
MLSMVDLAGSERVQRTQSSGVLLKEATYINKSLTFLEQVSIAILEGRKHVPYRCDALSHSVKGVNK